MNYKKYILMIIFSFLFIFNRENVFAMNTGFSIDEITTNEQEQILSYISITALDSEPEKKGIQCFDINEEGMIAIGSSNAERKKISIYDSDGKFQYGYCFTDNGTFGIQWDNNNILIYFVRGNVAIEVTPSCEIKNIVKIQDTIENNDYWNHVVFSTKRVIGDETYMIKNDMGFFNIFATSYSQLVSIDKNGESTILYDVNETQMLGTVIAVISFIILFCGIIIYLLKTYVWGSKHCTKIEL